MADISFAAVAATGLLAVGLTVVAIVSSFSGRLASPSLAAGPCGCETTAIVASSSGPASLTGLVGVLVLALLVIRTINVYRRSNLRVGEMNVVTLSPRLKHVAERLGLRSIRQIAGVRPEAFCSGLLQPKLFITTAAVEELSDNELLSVLKHEQYHLNRRDPLRILLADVILLPLRLVPGARRLIKEFRTGLELAADEHAVTSEASRTDLSLALLKFVQPSTVEAMLPSFAGTTDRRIDQLLGRPAWVYQLKFLGLMLVFAGLLLFVGTVQAREQAIDTATATATAGQCHQLRVRTCIAPPHLTPLYRTSVEFVIVR